MNCCNVGKKSKKCLRKSDGKEFKLPRRFSKKRCIYGKINGFTMRSSCAPYKDCKVKSGGHHHMVPNAVCVFHQNENGVSGKVIFKQEKSGLTIEYTIYGLSDGEHGFHIHQYGDLTENCKSACSHFNPNYQSHGGRTGKNRHLGDLGNILSKNKKATGKFRDKHLSLDMHSENCIVGRSVIVHKDRDDLGKGGDEESLKTGNAGARLACGVIGLAKDC